MLAEEKLSEQDCLILQRLTERCSDITKARVLALEFQRLLFTKDVNALNAWFTAVKSSLLSDLISFVTGLERESRETAISEVWSNGRTEAIPPVSAQARQVLLQGQDRCILGSRRTCEPIEVVEAPGLWKGWF